MSRYLKSYKMKLIAEGPVFVGNGKEFSKKEYVFLDRAHVGIVDIEKLYHYVQTVGLAADFEKFMLKDARADLKHWMLEHKISPDKMEKNMKYILDSGDTALERGTRLQIMQCIKDAYGMPYIPGSSVKGMLRTILLGADILENKEKYRRERAGLNQNIGCRKGRNYYLKREAELIEGRCYRTLARYEKESLDAVNDNMAGMIVSDSEPLCMDDVVLCQKLEKHVDGSEKKLNLLRECIRPETEIVFTLAIDESISPLKIDDIMAAATSFAENYFDKFKSRFPNVDRPKEHEVYLGGGSGFAGKTIIQSLYAQEEKEYIRVTQKIFEQTGVPRMHKHEKDMEYGVSPHILKCAKYQGRLFEMGLCRLEII